jgi:hypothetical protein
MAYAMCERRRGIEDEIKRNNCQRDARHDVAGCAKDVRGRLIVDAEKS